MVIVGVVLFVILVNLVVLIVVLVNVVAAAINCWSQKHKFTRLGLQCQTQAFPLPITKIFSNS